MNTAERAILSSRAINTSVVLKQVAKELEANNEKDALRAASFAQRELAKLVRKLEELNGVNSSWACPKCLYVSHTKNHDHVCKEVHK